MQQVVVGVARVSILRCDFAVAMEEEGASFGVGFSGRILDFGVGPHWVFSYLIKTARFGLVHFYSAVLHILKK